MCKHIPDELWRWQANIVTTIFVDDRQTKGPQLIFVWKKMEKNEKCLDLPDLARKLIRKTFRIFSFFLKKPKSA
jgi:hypothetical protein